MPAENATVAVFDNPAEAGGALRQLQAAGFRAEEISVAARDAESGETAACCFRSGTGMRYWGRSEAFWNAVGQALPGWAVLNLPGTRELLVAGRLAEWVAASLENAAIFAGLSPLGAALYSIGISREAIAGFEAALRDGKYLIIAHGPAGEVARAKRLLKPSSLGERGRVLD